MKLSVSKVTLLVSLVYGAGLASFIAMVISPLMAGVSLITWVTCTIVTVRLRVLFDSAHRSGQKIWVIANDEGLVCAQYPAERYCTPLAAFTYASALELCDNRKERIVCYAPRSSY